MATGTLARLVVAVGIDDSQMVSGIARTRASVLSNLAQLGAQAERSVEGTAANITRSNTGLMAAMAKPAAVGLITIAAVAAGLGMLAVKFESETSHIAAAANISSQSATKIGNDFLNAAGKSQTMVFTAEDMTNSYAAVAGQLALTDSKVNVVKEDMTFMKAAVDLAAGSNESLGAATTGVSSILQNFNLKMSDSTLAANTLFDASRGLHMSIPQVTDTFEKLQGRVGSAGLSIQDVSTLVEDMAQHSLTGQRNINLFAGAINQLLSGAASPAKAAAASGALKTAQLNLEAAQIKYNQAVAAGGPGNAAHQLALEKLQIAEEKLAAARASYPAMSKQVVEAQLRVQEAQVAATNSSVSGSSKVALAQIALQKAQDAVAKAQLAANGMSGNSEALLKHLGVTVYDSTGKFVGMRNVIGELHAAFAKMTPAQQEAAATTIFGTSAASAMTRIIDSGTVAWDKYANNVKHGETAHQGAIKATDNLAAAWSRIVGQIQADATKLSIGLEPVITSILTGISNDLPTIESIVTTAFTDIANIVKFAWGIIGPILGFFGHNLWIVEGFLAALVLKWLIVKGLNVAKEFANWGEAVAKFIAPGQPLSKLQQLFGLGEKGSITTSLQDMKNAWNDTFSTPQLLKAQNLGTAVEDSAKQIEGMASQLNAASLAQKIAPSDTGAELVQGWKDAITSARSDLVAKVTDFVNDPAIQNALTGDLEKGITNPRVLTALQGVLSTAESAMGGSAAIAFRTAVQDALSSGKITQGVADSLTNASAQWDKSLSSDLASAIKQGAKDAKIGDTIISDIATAAKDAGGIPGIIGDAKGLLGNVASRIVPFLAQPVSVISFGSEATATLAATSGGGGGIVNAIEKVAGGGFITAAIEAIGVGGLVTVAGSVIAGLGLGWLMVWANRNAKVDPGKAYGGGQPGKSSTATDTNIFADLKAGAAYGQSNNPRLSGLVGVQYQDIITQLEKRGLSEQNATADALIIEAAYKKGSSKTPPAVDNLINELVSGALVLQQTISQSVAAMRNNIKTTQSLINSGIKPGSAKALYGGGMITEPIFGVGMSGQTYTFGEGGNEIVTPVNSLGRTGAAMSGPNIPVPGVQGFTPVGAAQGVRQAPVIGTVIVNNPLPEPASTSVEERLRQISYLGQI